MDNLFLAFLEIIIGIYVATIVLRRIYLFAVTAKNSKELEQKKNEIKLEKKRIAAIIDNLPADSSPKDIQAILKDYFDYRLKLAEIENRPNYHVEDNRANMWKSETKTEKPVQ